MNIDRLLSILLVAAMLFFGTLNVVLKDWQLQLGFYQPYLWTGVTFLAQCFCLPIYYCSGSRDTGPQRKPPATVYIFALVTLFESAAFYFVNLAYLGLPGSVLQMLKGMKLIFTTILTVTILRKNIRSYQYLGVFVTLVGVVFVGYLSDTGKGFGWGNPSKVALCLLSMTLSNFVGALAVVWEEKVLKQYSVEPLLLAGMEGIFGVLYGIIVACCVQALHVADIKSGIQQLEHNNVILFVFLFYIVVLGFYNFSAITVTGHTSALLVTLLEVVRTGTVWVVEIAMSWDRFSLPEALAFATVVCGLLIYSKHIVVPGLWYEEEESLLPVKQFEGKKVLCCGFM